MKEKNKASAIHSLWLIDSLQNIEFHIHIIPCKHIGYLWQFRTFTGSYQSSLFSQDQAITYFSAETNRESFAWMKQHPLSNVSHHGWLSPWQLWPSYTVFFLLCCLRQNKVISKSTFQFFSYLLSFRILAERTALKHCMFPSECISQPIQNSIVFSGPMIINLFWLIVLFVLELCQSSFISSDQVFDPSSYYHSPLYPPNPSTFYPTPLF